MANTDPSLYGGMCVEIQTPHPHTTLNIDWVTPTPSLKVSQLQKYNFVKPRFLTNFENNTRFRYISTGTLYRYSLHTIQTPSHTPPYLPVECSDVTAVLGLVAVCLVVQDVGEDTRGLQCPQASSGVSRAATSWRADKSTSLT